MEIALNKGFGEMTFEEQMLIDGGATVGQAVGAVVGIAAICWAAPVGIVVGSAGLAVGMAVAGTGAVINLCW